MANEILEQKFSKKIELLLFKVGLKRPMFMLIGTFGAVTNKGFGSKCRSWIRVLEFGVIYSFNSLKSQWLVLSLSFVHFSG